MLSHAIVLFGISGHTDLFQFLVRSATVEASVTLCPQCEINFTSLHHMMLLLAFTVPVYAHTK